MSGQGGRAPHQAPYRRTYADGRFVWVARFYDRAGKARYAKPRWHGYKSTFALKRDAQRAIDEVLERQHGAPPAPQRLGEYFETWLERHPRSPRTNKTDANRVSTALSIEVDGRPLGEWEFDELRRHHVLELLDHMLRAEGRAARGARGIISSCSAMARTRLAMTRRLATPSMASGSAERIRGSQSRRGKSAYGALSRCAHLPAVGGRRCGR